LGESASLSTSQENIFHARTLPNFFVAAFLAAGLLGGLWCLTPADAKQAATPRIVLSKIISLIDLHDEAAAQLTLVKQYLDTKKSYADSAKHELPQAAGVLAVIGQAIAQHDSKPTAREPADQPPISGHLLRDTALKLAASKTQAEALALVPTLQAIINGRSSKTKATPRPWKGLISLHHVMEELNARNSRLRRAVRRPGDPKLDSRNAATMSLLGLVVLADTHEVKDKAELPKWNQYSVDFQTNAAATARALRSGDKKLIKPLYLKAAKACADCHSKFRSE